MRAVPRNLAIGCGATTLAVLAFGSCAVMVSSTVGSDESKAEVMCHSFVDKQLVSPATAEYALDTHIERTENGWDVRGVVDAENRMGATVRMQYRCSGLVNTGGDEWQVGDVVVVER